MHMGLRIGLAPQRVSSLTVILTGLIDGEARPGATIGYSINPDNGTETVAWGTAPGDDTYGTGANPTDFSADVGGALWLTVTDGGVTRSISAPIREAAVVAPSAAGLLADQTYNQNTGVRTYDASGDFTGTVDTFSLPTAPSGVTINSSTGVVSTDTGTTGLLSAQSVVVRATNSGGFADSGFSLTVQVAGSAINPVILGATYTGPSAGTGAVVNTSTQYTGGDTLTCYGVTSSSGTAPSIADIKAGSGAGTLEGFSFTVTPTSDTDAITGLTSTSETATHIHIFIEEDNNGGQSASETLAVSGLDFTLPAFSSASVNATADELTITFSEAVYGTSIPAAFTLSGVSAGTPTLGAISGLGTTTITMPITGNLPVNGDTLTLAYASATGDLTDVAANALASFTGQSVTNNVPAAGTVFLKDNFNRANGDLATGSADWTDVTVEAGTVANIVSNELQIGAPAAISLREVAYKAGVDTSANVTIQITYRSHTGTNPRSGIFARRQAGGNQVELRWLGSLGTIRIRDSANTALDATTAYTPAAGDIWELNCSASPPTARVIRGGSDHITLTLGGAAVTTGAGDMGIIGFGNSSTTFLDDFSTSIP